MQLGFQKMSIKLSCLLGIKSHKLVLEIIIVKKCAIIFKTKLRHIISIVRQYLCTQGWHY